eukprot:10171-Heterococcus_DN1.PRE.1
MAAALAYMHHEADRDYAYIFRDLKPENYASCTISATHTCSDRPHVHSEAAVYCTVVLSVCYVPEQQQLLL